MNARPHNAKLDVRPRLDGARSDSRCLSTLVIAAPGVRVWFARMWLLGLGLGLLGSLGGCMQPLLPTDLNRSPFDDYDRVRGQAASQKALDDFGIEKPNLRERLAPRD